MKKEAKSYATKSRYVKGIRGTKGRTSFVFRRASVNTVKDINRGSLGSSNCSH